MDVAGVIQADADGYIAELADLETLGTAAKTVAG